MKNLFLIILCTALTSACSTMKMASWSGVGGSKADGMVVLGIDVPGKNRVSETKIRWDVKQANAEAARRCRNWGYSNAEVFRESFPVQITCHPNGGSPCWSKTYRVTYQCIK